MPLLGERWRPSPASTGWRSAAERDGVRPRRREPAGDRVPHPDDLRPSGVISSHPDPAGRRSCSTTGRSASTCSCRAARRSSPRWTSTSPTRSTESTEAVAPCSRRSVSRRVHRRPREGGRTRRPGVRAEGRPHRGPKQMVVAPRARWQVSTVPTRPIDAYGGTSAATSRRWPTRSSSSRARAAPRVARIASLHDSGGERCCSSTSPPTRACRSRRSRRTRRRRSLAR